MKKSFVGILLLMSLSACGYQSSLEGVIINAAIDECRKSNSELNSIEFQGNAPYEKPYRVVGECDNKARFTFDLKDDKYIKQ